MVSITFQTAPPGAEVFLDSANTLRTTPVDLDVTEGTHGYMLRLNGYGDIIGTVAVIAGYSYLVQAVMTETTTSQSIEIYKQLVQLAWVGLAIGVIGLLVNLVKKKGN